jgi:hypothetical protein
LRHPKVYIFEAPNNFMKIKFLGMGWKTKISLKRATYSISINKLIAEGNILEKGEELHSYLAEDPKGRKIMITYLDGRKREK